MRRFRTHGDTIELWASLAALVLKALAMLLLKRLGFAPTCYHLAGPEGEKRGAMSRRPADRYRYVEMG